MSRSTALAKLGEGAAATILLAVLYPTLFVLSQNWYALNVQQVVWLLVVMPLAAVAIFAVVEGLLRLSARYFKSAPEDDHRRRAIFFGALSAGLLFFLLFRTLKTALGYEILLVLTYVGLAAVFILAFQRNLQRYINGFLAILSLVAVGSWAASALDPSQAVLEASKQDFESAAFKRKPNIYLLNYDGYGSDSLYRKVFGIDNAEQYQALASRHFKVLHTFSNYRDTLQTTISLFLGAHHYYATSTGFNDSQKGRPFLAGIVHNPVLAALKNNGYRLQYIHGLDYFVNEPGQLDYIFPPKHLASALRVFNIPILKMKRRISMDAQKDALYANMHAPEEGGAPWFTFAHVNKPSHADLAVDWREHDEFPKVYERRTQEANVHMLETIDRIRRIDPGAIIILYGDHGAHRYNMLSATEDPNAAFAKAGVPVEHVTLDQFGIMIAVASGGACDDYVYDGMTPTNMMRAIFACLAEDRNLLNGKAADISLSKGPNSELWRAADQGAVLSAWEPYEAPRTGP